MKRKSYKRIAKFQGNCFALHILGIEYETPSCVSYWKILCSSLGDIKMELQVFTPKRLSWKQLLERAAITQPQNLGVLKTPMIFIDVFLRDLIVPLLHIPNSKRFWNRLKLQMYSEIRPCLRRIKHLIWLTFSEYT